MVFWLAHDMMTSSPVVTFHFLGNARKSVSGPFRTFARNFANIDFFLKILPLKDDQLAMSEM